MSRFLATPSRFFDTLSRFFDAVEIFRQARRVSRQCRNFSSPIKLGRCTVFLCTAHDPCAHAPISCAVTTIPKSVNGRPAIFWPRGTFRARCGTFRAMWHFLGRRGSFLATWQLFGHVAVFWPRVSFPDAASAFLTFVSFPDAANVLTSPPAVFRNDCDSRALSEVNSNASGALRNWHSS